MRPPIVSASTSTPNTQTQSRLAHCRSDTMSVTARMQFRAACGAPRERPYTVAVVRCRALASRSFAVPSTQRTCGAAAP